MQVITSLRTNSDLTLSLGETRRVAQRPLEIEVRTVPPGGGGQALNGLPGRRGQGAGPHRFCAFVRWRDLPSANAAPLERNRAVVLGSRADKCLIDRTVCEAIEPTLSEPCRMEPSGPKRKEIE